MATPRDVKVHSHTRKYADKFPEFEPEAEVLLLLGADCDDALKTRNLSYKAPFINKTPLGFALVGRVCVLKKSSDAKCILHTQIIECPYETPDIKLSFKPKATPFEVFHSSIDDEEEGYSINDKQFLQIMETETKLNKEGQVHLPLPIKRTDFPHYEKSVYHRTVTTLQKMKTRSDLPDILSQMKKNIDKNYVEELPANNVSDGPSNYLPVFAVVHKRKKKPRLVFDASASYNGKSLNDCLLQGPDLNNSLRGVLIRFREKPIAFSADIESMFNAFIVPPGQRDLLRFFWWSNNDPQNRVVTFRARTHIFGCTSSPAVAKYGLKFCASHLKEDFELPAKKYLENDFYVDDGLSSNSTSDEAISTLKTAVDHLSKFKIRLHKITSNDESVLDAFPKSELTSKVTLVENDQAERALGIAWLTKEDKLIITSDPPVRPFTKRGILSVVNSLYDPIGMIAPVVLGGRIMQREILISGNQDTLLSPLSWDDELPPQYWSNWSEWLQTLSSLDGICINRSMYPKEFNPTTFELHCYCDASFQAIAYVIYARFTNMEEKVHISFVTGASKLAPRSAASIARLELCAAVEVTRAATAIIKELSTKPAQVVFYSDSKIVLGYLNNENRRFVKYVERRVEDVHKFSNTQQWTYVSTEDNPADHGTRPTTPRELRSSSWLEGPLQLHESSYHPPVYSASQQEIILPEEETAACILQTTVTQSQHVFSELINRESCFKKLSH